MKRITGYPRFTITLCIIVSCILLLARCIQKEKDEKPVVPGVQFGQFAGSATCATCHKNIYDKHRFTAHYLTSRPALEKNINGSFEHDRNSFTFSDYVQVVMEKRDSGFYQVQYGDGREIKARRMDIVIGSATKGQSYLSWVNNRLTQLPITFFTAAGGWSNSPGYPGRPVFNRPVTSRCLECHSTYFRVVSDPGKEPEEFDHTQLIYGVDCEKCHGPAAAHVSFQSQHPKESRGKYIINPATFSRRQSLDLCMLCHGGRLTKTQPSLSFQAGDTLSGYFTMDTAGKSPDNIDVHGNQYGLLAASRCFKMSEMTCITCHNPHENEKGLITVFSQRCMNCHNNGKAHPCKMTATLGTMITQNCIDCHMPKQPSFAIAVMLQGATTPTAASLRTHFIKIYPDETKQVLAEWDKWKTGGNPTSRPGSH